MYLLENFNIFIYSVSMKFALILDTRMNLCNFSVILRINWPEIGLKRALFDGLKKFFKKSKKILKKVLTNKNYCDIIISVARENGSIAQLGEHLPYKQRVIGSSPIVSTIKRIQCIRFNKRRCSSVG